MNTPETKLTVETCNGAFSPAPSITFHNANREVLRITHDGHIICGEGLSVNAATQEAAKLLIASFEQEIKKMVDNRIAAMQNENRYFETCAELAAMTARAEKAEAALKKIKDVMRQDSNGKDPMDAVEDIVTAAIKKASK
jgi:hypothetical protein